MWEWKTKKVRNLPEQVAYNSERLNELQDGDTWTAIKELRLRILNIEDTYQDKNQKNMPNGYAGLNANGEIEAIRILNFLKGFLNIPSEYVPNVSVLREFIGNSYYE